jgi:transcriptional regulator with XRE-family HTH domain
MVRAPDETGIIAAIAHNVRAKRKALGLSQEALADGAGVDRTYVSQVERRQRNLTVTVLARLAKALKVSPGELLAPAALRPKIRKGVG